MSTLTTLQETSKTCLKSKDKEIERLLELVLENTLKLKDLVELLSLDSEQADLEQSLELSKKEAEDLAHFAMQQRLIEQKGKKLKISTQGEKFLFSSRIYAR